jgi:hypothetical protein
MGKLKIVPLLGCDCGLAKDAPNGTDRHIFILFWDYRCVRSEECHFFKLYVTPYLTGFNKSSGFEAAFYFTVWKGIKRHVFRGRMCTTEGESSPQAAQDEV